ncbi:MAG: FMN-binding protein [Pseudomonadales bacterium]
MADPRSRQPSAAGWRVRSVAAFVVLVMLCAGLLAMTAALTREQIEHNRNRQFLDLVETLTGVPPGDTISWQGDVAPLCDGPGGAPRRLLLRGRAAGYGGSIYWLAAADMSARNPTLTGVRITAHQETPGIADFLDRPERGWLATLPGRDAAGIAAVDAVSGATITSRALRDTIAQRLGDPALTAVECGP